MKRFNIICFLLLCTAGLIHSQEALKSVEEEYYDFLSLQGLVDRPTLNYRTLSDSVWTVPDSTEHPWNDQNLGTTRYFFNNTLKLKIYGPELFMSVNTAAPYGQNDGALWQGKGFNSSFTTGVRLEAYGIEATFKPQLAFSQNVDFEIMQSKYDSEYGYFWAYNWNTGVDAPQRFGDKPFFTYDWGDSEIRYTWKTLTIGFGTQAVWLGPAYLNPLLHSNNAPSYPKFDIGIRKQPITIPWINWYMGDVEFRIWTGYLSESDYFDNNPANDHIMFHGLSFAYAPSFLPGLTLFANRVCLVPWEWENLKYIFPSDDNTIEDQKASFGLSYYFPQVGFEVFAELGIDDYVAGQLGYIRYPFATTTYTTGIKKTVSISASKNIYGQINFEFNWFEPPQGFQFHHWYAFYFHHLITQGYTNKGQWLGAGIGNGGNSQYLDFTLYYPKGNSTIFISRNNPDVGYLYKDAVYASAQDGKLSREHHNNYWTNFLVGASTAYFINSSLKISGGLVYNLIINQYYQRGNLDETTADILKHNVHIQIGIQFQIPGLL